jgi:hypothetical protein
MNVECRRDAFCLFKKTEQHAAQLPALHEQICPSKFNSAAFDRLGPPGPEHIEESCSTLT